MWLDFDIENCDQIYTTLLLGYDTRSLRKSFLTFQGTYWTQLQAYECRRRFYSDMYNINQQMYIYNVVNHILFSFINIFRSYDKNTINTACLCIVYCMCILLYFNNIILYTFEHKERYRKNCNLKIVSSHIFVPVCILIL